MTKAKSEIHNQRKTQWTIAGFAGGKEPQARGKALRLVGLHRGEVRASRAVGKF